MALHHRLYAFDLSPSKRIHGNIFRYHHIQFTHRVIIIVADKRMNDLFLEELLGINLQEQHLRA